MSQYNHASLEIQDLAFERNHQSLFQGINIQLRSGDFLQIQGANGSGKSTFLRILAGLLEPYDGNIIWQEQSIFQQRERYQQHIHYVGHQNGIKSSLTPYENLQLIGALYAIKKKPSHLKHVIDKMGLSHLMNFQTQRLSAGQQRRLSLAKLLLYPLPLWILDEPTTALDAEGQNLLLRMLKEHVDRNGIAIVATHQALPLKNNFVIHLGGDADV